MPRSHSPSKERPISPWHLEILTWVKGLLVFDTWKFTPGWLASKPGKWNKTKIKSLCKMCQMCQMCQKCQICQICEMSLGLASGILPPWFACNVQPKTANHRAPQILLQPLAGMDSGKRGHLPSSISLSMLERMMLQKGCLTLYLRDLPITYFETEGKDGYGWCWLASESFVDYK